MKNLGILITRPGMNQLFLTMIQQLAKLPPDINTTVFAADYGPTPAGCTFPIMDLMHCYNYEGVLISTDLYTSMVLLNALCPTKRYFYVWDLEYTLMPQSANNMQNIYNNDKLELIARNDFRSKILEKTWKKPHSIIEEFNHVKLQELF